MATIKKEPVKLRTKQLVNGNQSLYLDIYYKGKRNYEFLNLYLIPERNAADRSVNKETLKLAEKVRIKRLAELHQGQYSFEKKSQSPFIMDWLEDVRVEKESKMTHKPRFSVWKTLLASVGRYGKNVRLDAIDAKWVEGFKTYLERTNHKSNYVRNVLVNVSVALNMAIKRGYIDKNPVDSVELPTYHETERVFLTLDELKKLAATPCAFPELKRAFIFSCLTGLRRSDMVQLKWKDVSLVDGYTRLTFKQWKTKGQMYLDISEQAAEYMGERGEPEEHVFDSMLLENHEIGIRLRAWAATAGITKHISYHCSRHTFAVLMVTLDTDLYTISKLLGHADISTTQIYAKVVDKVRREAVSKIPEI